MARELDTKGGVQADAEVSSASFRPTGDHGVLARLSRPERTAGIALLVVLFLIAAYLRYALRGGVTGDYTDFFLVWYTTLDEQGFAAFSTNFANYNFPYLFLLLLTTYLPVSSLVAVKLVAVFGDALLAFATYRLSATLRPLGWAKWIATAAVMIAPSVFIVSAYWGQVDAIYTAFLLLSANAVVRRRYNWVWLWWGIALAFKLQAIFLLPFLLVVVLTRSFRWQHPFIAAAAFFAMSIPPVLAGNSLGGTFGVYLGQTSNQWRASYGSASVYEWIPNSLVPFIGGAGTAVAFAVILALCVLVALRCRLSDDALIQIAFLSTLATPLLLPFMHDRYFYPATVLAILVAGSRPTLLWVSLILQPVAIWCYMQYLTNETIVPLAWAPALVLVVVWVVGRTVLRQGPRGRVPPGELPDAVVPDPPLPGQVR